jgi:hypothetical protein
MGAVVAVVASIASIAAIPLCAGLIRPVSGAVVAAFAPVGDYAGHWGVDLAAAPGTVVRAPGAGVVSFSGTVAGRRSVTIDLGDAVPARHDLEVAVLDGSRDGRPRYDTIGFRIAGEEEWRLIGEREWFEVAFDVRAREDLRPRRYAVWSKGLRLDRFGGALRLYRGGVWRLKAYPDPFEDRLTDAVGPWPGLPDEELVADWWLDAARGIDLDTFLEQIERLDRYLDDLARWVIDGEEFGLLLAYHPTPDTYQHSSLLTDPEQWGWSPGKAVAAREGLKRVGRSVDRSVAALWRTLDGDRDALVVVSDHGHVPVHDLVLVHRVLAEAGLVELDAGGSVTSSSPMVAAGHGGSAHLYLNLVGREPGGVVEPARADELLLRAARALADINVDGEPVVERVFTRAESAAIGLDHPSSGDLIAFLRPGFAFSERVDGETLEPSPYYGQHGYLAHHDPMCGILFARGGAIKSALRDDLQAIDVAPMVAGMLGVELR